MTISVIVKPLKGKAKEDFIYGDNPKKGDLVRLSDGRLATVIRFNKKRAVYTVDLIDGEAWIDAWPHQITPVKASDDSN